MHGCLTKPCLAVSPLFVYPAVGISCHSSSHSNAAIAPGPATCRIGYMRKCPAVAWTLRVAARTLVGFNVWGLAQCMSSADMLSAVLLQRTVRDAVDDHSQGGCGSCSRAWVSMPCTASLWSAGNTIRSDVSNMDMSRVERYLLRAKSASARGKAVVFIAERLLQLLPGS